MKPPHSPAIRTLLRGICKRCPRCGQGPLFRKWYTLFDRCPECDLEYQPRDGDNWGFMYLGTAFVTGILAVGILLLTPPNLWIGRVVLLVAAVVALGGTLPNRKGFAIAFDYVIRRHWDDADTSGPPEPVDAPTQERDPQ